jgi:hypothetical protein
MVERHPPFPRVLVSTKPLRCGIDTIVICPGRSAIYRSSETLQFQPIGYGITFWTAAALVSRRGRPMAMSEIAELVKTLPGGGKSREPANNATTLRMVVRDVLPRIGLQMVRASRGNWMLRDLHGLPRDEAVEAWKDHYLGVAGAVDAG